MSGECYFNKWSLTEPQCTNTEVGRRPNVGNSTDEWTWCEYHGGIIEPERTSEEGKHE